MIAEIMPIIIKNVQINGQVNFFLAFKVLSII